MSDRAYSLSAEMISEGVHVMKVDEGELICSLIDSMGIGEDFARSYLKLLTMVKPGKGARMIVHFEGKAPIGMSRAFLVVRLIVMPDREIDYGVVMIVAEEGWEEEALKIAVGVKQAFIAMTVKNGTDT